MMTSQFFSPTAAVRDSSRRWMEGEGGAATATRTTSSVSIDREALDKFAAEITQSILSNQSLEVTEWDADGWHYTGKNYQHEAGGGGSGDDVDDHHRELMRMERVALYVLTLDAINFCFWPLSTPESGKSDAAISVNGLEYEHLAVALRKIAEADDEVISVDDDDDGAVDNSSSGSGTAGIIIRAASSYALSPANLAAMTPAKLRSMLHPHLPPSSGDTQYELPNIEVRCRLLNELGRGISDRHDGSALRMIGKARRSADALVAIVLDTFPGFRDYVDTKEWDHAATSSAAAAAAAASSPAAHDWESAKSSPSVIHFYKRAQIAIADIWAALGRHHHHRNSSSATTPDTTSAEAHRICQFDDMELVTTFPDYRVPQILRHVEVMQYEPSLATLVDGKAELERGGIDEVSIRAGTVVAVEEIVKKVKEKIAEADGSAGRSRGDLRRLADDVSAVTIDWYLWQRGEKLDRSGSLGPHHRVRTTFY